MLYSTNQRLRAAVLSAIETLIVMLAAETRVCEEQEAARIVTTCRHNRTL